MRNCETVFHSSSIMDTTTWLKLKHLNNPDQYGLDMWRSAGHTTLKDRVEALQGMTMFECKDPFMDILEKYNARTSSMFDKFKSIPANLVVGDDLTIMTVDMCEKLQHAVNARESQKILVNVTANALRFLSREEIMRVTVNSLIFAKLHPGVEPSCDEMVHNMLHQPTFEQIQTIGLDAANLELVIKTLEIQVSN